MSYKLADGSDSLEYEIGDMFIYTGNSNGQILKFSVQDHSSCPYFLWGSDSIASACSWERLTPVKRKKAVKQVKILTVETQNKISDLHGDIQRLVPLDLTGSLNLLLNNLDDLYQKELQL